MMGDEAALDDLRRVHLELFALLDGDPVLALLVTSSALHSMRELGLIDADPDRLRVLMAIASSALQLIGRGEFPRTPSADAALQTAQGDAQTAQAHGSFPRLRRCG
ncbi:MAG: hypothetical protein M0O99_02305 [Desulfuromonas thiophila]|jgi:hypothetical protein|nr:hypothetical protein [Desulfuromonas thiophila]